jgi:hypothetical protein
MLGISRGILPGLLKSGKLSMGKFDFIFIDTLHTKEFSIGYCLDIFNPHTQNVIVAINDIFADATRGSSVPAIVYKFLAMAASCVTNFFTMSLFVMPNLNFLLTNARAKSTRFVPNMACMV